MEKRTAEIIMICKGHHEYGKDLNYKQAIAAFLSDQCLCPIEYYTDDVINQIIWNAAIDYINSFKVHRPGSFLQYAKEVFDRHNDPMMNNVLNKIDMYEAICIAFHMAQVRDDNGFINGFTKENTQFVRKQHESI